MKTKGCVGWGILLATLAMAGCKTTPPAEQAEASAAGKERDELQRLTDRLAKGPLAPEETDAYFVLAQQLLIEKKMELAERFFAAVFEVHPTLVGGMRLAEIYILGNRFEEAERIVLKLSVLFPRTSEPAVALSRVQFMQGRTDEALRTLKSAFSVNPNDEAVAAPYVELLLRQGKDAEARKTLEKLVKNPAVVPYFLQKLAEMEIREKRIPEAKAHLDRLLRVAPENVEGWTLAGFIAMEEKDNLAAERYFREAHLKQPDNDSLARYYVLQLLRQEKFREARRLLVKLEGGSEPGKGLDPELTFQLGYVFFQLDEYDEALKRFLSLVGKSEDDGRPLFFVGQCEEALKRPSEARAAYEKVPESSRFHRQSVVRRVYLRLEAGELEEARRLVPSLGISNESDENDYRSLALIHARLKEHGKAIEIAKAGLKKFPESADLAFHAASWLEHTGTRDEAVAATEALLRKHPEHPQALNYVAYTLAEANIRLDAALRMATLAVKLQPKDPFFLDTLGWVYFRLGRFSEAELQLVRALAIEPDEPIVYEHLAEVFLGRGDLAGALKHFELAERKFASQPQWKVENDREWRESRQRVNARIAEIRKRALP